MEFHLAPLKNISCWAFRAGIPGATDVYTEMIMLKTLRLSPQKFWTAVDTYPLPSSEIKQWVQLLTNNPEDIGKLIHDLPSFLEKNPKKSNIYGFNINLGCPDPQIMAEGLGACQLKQTKQIKKLIKFFLSKEHIYYLSLKIRLGESYQDMVDNSFLKILETYQKFDDPRLSPIIIHFKHAQQTSKEPCRWEMLEPILDLEIPIIINGQISHPADLKEIKSSLPRRYINLWDQFVKGIMVGRGILTDPFCLTRFSPGSYQISRENWTKEISGLISKYVVEERVKKNLESIYGLTT